MNPNLSCRDMLQWAFALSPVPSYLPQYFSIMRQLTSAATASTGAAEPGPGPEPEPEPEPARATIERGGDHLRKRNWQLQDQDSQLSSIFKGPPNSDGAVGPVAGGHSKSFEQQFYGANHGGGGGEGADPSKLDAGLSRATVLLLLSSHLLRLLYFHGLLLEERRPAPPIASAGSEPIEPPTAPSDPASRVPALQWDLLGQSLSMIVVQFMLLHATMLLRRKQLRRQRARMASNGADSGRSSSTNSLLLLSSGVTESPGSDHGHGNNHTLNDRGPSFWEVRWRRLSHDMSAHFHNLLSPHSILQTHTFLEYLELLFLSSMLVKLVFDYHWYPRYRMGVVEGLKHTSICMESCLALPQMIRNYRNQTTEGLSVSILLVWYASLIIVHEAYS